MLGRYTFRKLAFIGTYAPRRCGIATFTADLVEAPELNCLITAPNNTPEGYPYPARVRFEGCPK